MKAINRAFLQIAQRAERQDDEILRKTFVDYGAVFEAISSIDHQIVFGRRGTGKTHLLTYLRQSRKGAGETAVQLDMRLIGSDGGIFGDSSIPVAQRATRLLIDVLAAVHNAIYEQAVEDNSLIDLSRVAVPLDLLFDAHHSVKVVPTSVTLVESTTAQNDQSMSAKVGGTVGLTAASVTAEASIGTTDKGIVSANKTVVGVERHHVNFGSVGDAIRKLADALPNKRLWVMIDEWSEVPRELQPYLAEMLKRALMPARGITVKIAAIEQRTKFSVPDESAGHIGLEPGADISTAINLDDFMVFDNDESRSVTFFRSLVFQHVKALLEAKAAAAAAAAASTAPAAAAMPSSSHAVASGEHVEDVPVIGSAEELVSKAFTQTNAFDEVVRACEGVPRDAINILSTAAKLAGDATISVGEVRKAARQWYIGSKDSVVNSHERAKELLNWIVDKVIKERRTKAFLLESSTRDALIDYLYDERVLHVLRKGMSSKEEPGIRFNVYGIDYGCYVDLVSTTLAPKGMLDLGDAQESEFTPSVPKTDFRSIRRCVLNLSDFYVATTMQKENSPH